MKILLADDDPKIHLVVRLWLERHGHTTVSARNGQEAHEKMQAEKFDILVTDVNMPLMKGTELTRTALDMPTCPELIVMLTSRCDRADLQAAINSGKVHLFNKPFSPQDLAKLIDEVRIQPAEA